MLHVTLISMWLALRARLAQRAVEDRSRPRCPSRCLDGALRGAKEADAILYHAKPDMKVNVGWQTIQASRGSKRDCGFRSQNANHYTTRPPKDPREGLRESSLG